MKQGDCQNIVLISPGRKEGMSYRIITKGKKIKCPRCKEDVWASKQKKYTLCEECWLYFKGRGEKGMKELQRYLINYEAENDKV